MVWDIGSCFGAMFYRPSKSQERFCRGPRESGANAALAPELWSNRLPLSSQPLSKGSGGHQQSSGENKSRFSFSSGEVIGTFARLQGATRTRSIDYFRTRINPNSLGISLAGSRLQGIVEE